MLLEANPLSTLHKKSHVPNSDFFIEDGLFQHSAPRRRRRICQRHTYNQLVIPVEFVPTVLRPFHEVPTSSHSGINKAIKTTRSCYFFPRLASTITEHIQKCQLFLLYKGSMSVPAPALIYDIPERPFQSIIVDVFSGFSVSLNCKSS